MATVTAAVSASDGTDDTPLTTGSFTPAANDLLVAVAMVTGNGNLLGHAFTDSQGLGWTNLQTVRSNASADSMTMAVANTLAAASSMTVTFTASGGTGTGINISVMRVSGMTRTGSSAVRSQAGQSNGAGGTTPAPAFSPAALTGNPTIGAVANANDPATMTEPTGWTEVHDIGFGLTAGLETVSRDSGFTGTTITWGSTSGTGFGSKILELDASVPSSVSKNIVNSFARPRSNNY